MTRSVWHLRALVVAVMVTLAAGLPVMVWTDTPLWAYWVTSFLLSAWWRLTGAPSERG